jgi:hypothetical protein
MGGTGYLHKGAILLLGQFAPFNSCVQFEARKLNITHVHTIYFMLSRSHVNQRSLPKVPGIRLFL